MKNIWLVCEEVDLGYHVLEAYSNEKKAKDALDKLNKNHHDRGYQWTPPYFVETRKISK